MKICIVGGVAGGASAATRLRRLSEDADIVLFEKGDYISYANCGLPYYIGGAIQEKDALLVTKPDLLRNRFRIDVRTENEVLAIHRAEKELQVKNLRTGEVYTESYDKLILSPGAEPKRPPLPGIDLDGVFTLRTVTDMERIDAYLKGRSASRAVVVGGGFIGVEMAENLQRRGLDVTIVEFADQVVASLDPEMAQILHRHLTEHGVSLRLKTGLAGIAQVDTGLQVELSDGSAIESDLVLLSIGVFSGKQAGKRGRIASRRGQQYRCKRILPNVRPEHLCSWGRHRRDASGQRKGNAGPAGRSGQQTGAARCRKCVGRPSSCTAGAGKLGVESV